MIIKKLISMRIKSIIIVLFCAGCFYQAGAQQIFAISQYMQHNFIYNPAASGAADDPSIGAIYRKMWSGIDGGPQTTILYGDTHFDKKKVGLSAFVYDDKTGPTERIGGQFGLSYGVQLDKTNTRKLMFGIGGSFLQYKIDKTDIIDNPADYAGDNALISAPNSKFTGDAAAGVYYKSPTLNVGVSVQQIIQTQLGFINESNTTTVGKLYRHYYVQADYKLKVDEDDDLIPNALLMYQPNSPIDLQAGARLMHADFIWIGFGYHYQQSFSAYAGVKIDHRFEIGYAYDQYQTPLSFVSTSGSAANELSLRYYFIK